MYLMKKKSVSIGPADTTEATTEADAKQKRTRNKQSSGRSKLREQWRVPPRYEVRQTLGSGAYGTVCQARDKDQKCLVAIKQAKNLFDDLIDAKRLLREICILGKLSHPRIVKCYDVIVPHDLVKFNEIYIVLEICDSDLKKLCRADVNLSKTHVSTLMYNLLAGLNYLHSAAILHRDLKPANCLVNEDCVVKICDFGLSRAVGGDGASSDEDAEGETKNRNLTGHVVTRWYRAPELILLQKDYSGAIDIWSAGCIFAELLAMYEGTKYSDRGPLFPGHTCFPLSPHSVHRNDTKYYTKGAHDQLSMIWMMIGTPSEEEILQLSGKDAQAYARCFAKRDPGGLADKFSYADSPAITLLQNMLMFDQSKRPTTTACLDDAFFSMRRQKELEIWAEDQVSMDFDNGELDLKQLRRLFLREVRRYHPEVPTV